MMSQKEKMMEGLRKETHHYFNLYVAHVVGIGKGLFTSSRIGHGEFVIEYTGEFLVGKEQIQEKEKIYAATEEGCFIFNGMWGGESVAIDATRDKGLGRYINHAIDGNLGVFRLLQVDDEWPPRLALYASRPILPNEELRYDYGVRDNEIPWLKSYMVREIHIGHIYMTVFWGGGSAVEGGPIMFSGCPNV